MIDRPGYGYSDRPRGLWTRARTPRCSRRRFSSSVFRRLSCSTLLGAWSRVALALQAPQLVRSLVLASGYYYPTLRADVMLSSPVGNSRHR